ncbi:MAG: hypothetical protein AAGA25_08555, partial [Planctomycetota bacterium]
MPTQHRGEDDVEDAAAVFAVVGLVGVEVDDERVADEAVGRLVRVATEVQLGDEGFVTCGTDEVVDMRRAEASAALVGAGVDGFEFVAALLVGEDAGAVEEDVVGGRVGGVVVVVAALGVGLPDVEGDPRKGF